ncbi:MAG: hypothetical protein IJI27_07940 [Oscillospiraceae bacterium]|nr:hypothetical protein [Oscillospiraceae bacterium]
MAAKKEALTPAMKKEIVELVIETYQKEQEKAKKAVMDRKLYNTRLLLINYRGLAANCESAIYEASQCEEDVYDILENLMSGRTTETTIRVESIRQSAAKTKVMIEHINKALEDYETYCLRSNKDEEMRRCRVIKALYVMPEALTAEEIAEQENIDISTVYKDVKAATRRLTPRIFGVDGLM